MNSEDQEHSERFRKSIEKMDERYGEVFRRLAQGEGEEPKHDEISDEELRAATDRAIERNSDTCKRLADS